MKYIVLLNDGERLQLFGLGKFFILSFSLPNKPHSQKKNIIIIVYILHALIQSLVFVETNQFFALERWNLGFEFLKPLSWLKNIHDLKNDWHD